jgi:DNA-binding NarL/FixJ family response regulator
MSGLLERDAELTALDAAAADAAAGRGRLVVIEGPAGIGKSGLLADLRERSHALRVRPARAGELEREFAFGVVRQLFEGIVADPAQRAGALAGAAAAAGPVFGVPGESDEGVASFAALHGLFWLTANLAAEQPLLLAIDDLHWCDRPSLRFLAYLARRLEGLPILVAATVRSAEPGTDAAMLVELTHDPTTLAVRPAPLSDAAVAALVRDRLGAGADDAFCAACHDATGGNPLLLRQLLRALEVEGVTPEAGHVGVVRAVGPRAASATVLLRLGRLPADAAAVARAVAVLGESATVPAVAGLAGLDEAAVAAATGALARTEILRPDPPLGFVHPLVRDAVYHELPPGERALAHERAAGALRAAGAPAEQVAAQLLEAPRRGDPAVVDVLEEAGRTAMRRGASDSAVAYLQRALEEPPPGERRTGVLLALGGAEALTNGQAAAEHLAEAYAAIEEPELRAMVADGLVRVLIFTDRRPEAAALARRAAAELPPGHEAQAALFEALELATNYIGDLSAEKTERVARHRDPADVPALVAMAAIDWSFRGGSAGACAALALAALEHGDLVRRENGMFSISAITVLGLADRDEAVEMWDASLEAAHRDGSLFSVASIHLFYGMTLLWRGDLPGAAAMLHQGKEEFAAWGFGATGQVYLDAHLAQILLEQGDVPAARAALEQSSAPDERSDALRYRLNSELALLVAEGRWEEALALTAAIRRAFGLYTSPSAGRWRSLAAIALHRLGRRDEAVALAAEEVAHARAWGAPGALGNALRVLGQLEGRIDALEEAVAVLTGSPARLDLAKALAAHGAALRHARRPGDAREPLRAALELAVACDAPALVEHVRTELYAAGARPRTDALGGVAALTASERRVVERAATGETNRDIAQALFVTPKTVEVHLSNAYRKLGIRSRRELPAALAR